MNGDEQIVARFMIEQLQFLGVRPRKRPPASRAMITMRYPAVNGPTITEYFLPSAFQAGLRLEASGAQLWNAFVRAHAGAQLAGSPEIQMDYFTRAVECLLAEAFATTGRNSALDESYWTRRIGVCRRAPLGH